MTRTPLEPSIHVSILTQFYPPDYAATGQLIEELAKCLQEDGLKIQVFTGQPSYAFRKEKATVIEKSGQLSVRRSGVTRFFPNRIRGKVINGLLFVLRTALHLLRLKNRGEILLITTAPPFLPFLGYLANRLFQTPYICLLYDLYPDVAVQLKVVSSENWLVKIWHFINRCTWEKAAGIIVPSAAMKERIIAKYPEMNHKVFVIHNWANPAQIVPMPKENNRFALKHHLAKKFTVLYSGNLGRCHDAETILAAAEQLRHEPIEFVFIGSGAKYQVCIDQVKQLGLQNCQFLPYQDRTDLPYSLTACDISLVSVSAGMEGLLAPSKLYSALAAGRPIAAICEEQSYLRQLLAEAQCGAAFDNNDGVGLANFIRCLKSDRALAQKLGNAGREYLKTHFTPTLIAKQYAKILLQTAQTIKASNTSDSSHDGSKQLVNSVSQLKEP
jgi:glycosyltransferase involved in cell wall biosynthesis